MLESSNTTRQLPTSTTCSSRSLPSVALCIGSRSSWLPANQRNGASRAPNLRKRVGIEAAVLGDVAGGENQVDPRLLRATRSTTFSRLWAVSMPSRRAPSSANRWLSESCTSSTEASVAGVFEWRDKGPSPEGEASAVKG